MIFQISGPNRSNFSKIKVIFFVITGLSVLYSLLSKIYFKFSWSFMTWRIYTFYVQSFNSTSKTSKANPQTSKLTWLMHSVKNPKKSFFRKCFKSTLCSQYLVIIMVKFRYDRPNYFSSNRLVLSDISWLISIVVIGRWYFSV